MTEVKQKGWYVLESIRTDSWPYAGNNVIMGPVSEATACRVASQSGGKARYWDGTQWRILGVGL